MDNRIIKASFKDIAIAERKSFPKSICLMPISVGQPVHEGAKFAAVIQLINASFQQCTILIDDSIQRHTLAIMDHSLPDELHCQALAEGEAWLKRNHAIYSRLTIPFNLMRWDDWYLHPNYLESLSLLHAEYRINELFRTAIDANIHEFLNRYLRRSSNESVNYEHAFSCCYNYLIEECAIMCLWPEKKYHFEVYPHGRNKAMTATYEHLIKPQYPDCLKPVALRFKKYPAKAKTFAIDRDNSAASTVY